MGIKSPIQQGIGRGSRFTGETADSSKKRMADDLFPLFLSALAIAFVKKFHGTNIKIWSPLAFCLIFIWLTLLYSAAEIAGYANRIRIF